MTHSGGSLMIWGCISSKGVCELVFIGILDKNKYLSILKDNLIKSANNMNIRDSFKFYQDNDLKYKSRIFCLNIFAIPELSKILSIV